MISHSGASVGSVAGAEGGSSCGSVSGLALLLLYWGLLQNWGELHVSAHSQPRQLSSFWPWHPGAGKRFDQKDLDTIHVFSSIFMDFVVFVLFMFFAVFVIFVFFVFFTRLWISRFSRGFHGLWAVSHVQ